MNAEFQKAKETAENPAFWRQVKAGFVLDPNVEYLCFGSLLFKFEWKSNFIDGTGEDINNYPFRVICREYAREFCASSGIEWEENDSRDTLFDKIFPDEHKIRLKFLDWMLKRVKNDPFFVHDYES